ncbi:MAG: putative acyltransferase [Myxococcaceae bacterium]|nr:putative acyltransferase [Myxococcaceae bacterium]
MSSHYAELPQGAVRESSSRDAGQAARSKPAARPPAHIPSLDGLRGIAAALVVLEHFRFVGLRAAVSMPVGDYGVLLFFILSGFLMGYLYLETPFDRAAAIRYAAARVSRIAPLYYATITASYILTFIVGSDFIYALNTTEFVRLLLFVGNAHVFWSIAPEVQFYFVFMMLWWAHQTGKLSSATTAIPLFLLGALVCGAQPLAPGFMVTAKLPIFLTGILIAVARVQLRSEVRSVGAARWLALTQLVALAILGLLLFHPLPDLVPGQSLLRGHDPKHNGVFGDYRYLALLSATLFTLSVETPLSRALLANRFMRALGQYSFSIYLLHEPVMAGVHALLEPLALPYALQVGLALVAVGAVGVLSYYLLERPAQTHLRRYLLEKWSGVLPLRSPEPLGERA